MTTTLERDLEGPAALDLDPQPSVFEPLTVTDRYGSPKGRISPNRELGWLARALPVIAAHKWMFTAALVTSVMAMAAMVAGPRVMMAAIDAVPRAAQGGGSATLMPYIGALFGLAAARGILLYLYRFWLFKVAFLIEYDLRSGVYEHLARMSFSFYDRVQSGQLISRANADIKAVQMFLTFVPGMVLQMASFLMAFVLMAQVHLLLALVAIVPLPVVFLVALKLRTLMFPISWIVQARVADVTTVVEENLTGQQIVKSFCAEEQQIKHLTKTAQRLRWASVEQIDVRAHYGPIMENLPRIGMAAVLLYGGYLVIQGSITVGAIVAFSTYVVMLQAPFQMLGHVMMMSQRAAASAGRVYEILDENSDIVDRPEAADLPSTEGHVRFENVTFSYADGPKVLDGFDFELEPGETVAIVGRTGSGKSTVARLLMRFYEVDDGAITLDGRDIRDITQTSLRHHIGAVFDEAFLFSTSVRDNIAYARPDADPDAVRSVAEAANASEFIDQLDEAYETMVGERGYTLSGGQRQRISIARALLHNPKVLILDDATSAIDVKIEDEIHSALRGQMQGRTTLIIAQRLSTISLADRVVLLDGGRVVADGSHAELMATEPRYAEVLAHIDEDLEAKVAERAKQEALRQKMEEIDEKIVNLMGGSAGDSVSGRSGGTA